MTRIWVLSATRGQCKQFEELLAGFVASIPWQPQAFTPSTFQCIVEADLDAAWLTSEVSKLGIPFEVEGQTELFLYHPGLGIHRSELDQAGEPVVRIGQVKQLLAESKGSSVELARLLRLAEGLPWLDLLEPYRLGKIRAAQLPKAV